MRYMGRCGLSLPTTCRCGMGILLGWNLALYTLCAKKLSIFIHHFASFASSRGEKVVLIDREPEAVCSQSTIHPTLSPPRFLPNAVPSPRQP
ncbi:hypothetical protein EJ05DRAFT_21977 [Pseudovirgaria hyperparasitica]|uniref:Uncharacterized protein n=1 Tax=Pseudovirgaria hyperparasitica TaxID=470096 RepID=A0A6A6WLT2_9PEZI|nr:uncharacterized protein EJ05DRAFT_21977 [Pseudovirgaria hyperparasitica]KAF2762969.1 hypothetical protein EJ05DRAFT_21977 [Pseudovirgaria hyperparasitica]